MEQILFYILMAYIIITLTLFFSIYILEILIRKIIKNKVNKSIMFKYLNEEIIEELMDEMSISIREHQFILDFIIFPAIILVPFLGQPFLFRLYAEIYSFFKKLPNGYIENYCKNYMAESIKNKSSIFNKHLNLIKKYSNDDENTIYNFFINDNHPYYVLGLSNFETIISIITEKEKQIPYMNVVETKNLKDELSLIIKEYIQLLIELNNNAKKKFSNNYDIKNYYNFLKSMINDIKDGKY